MEPEHPHWPDDVSASDWLFQNYSDRSLPPGYLEAYMAGQRRRHAIAQAEIDKIFAEAETDPEKLARLKAARF
jgi:hypothetical protein